MKSPVIVGDHPIVRKVANLSARLAHTLHPVLVAGERGSGRHLVARVLHTGGRRAAARLVTVDCGAVAEVEAARRADVLIAAAEAASGGTLYLKDVERLGDTSWRQLMVALGREDARLVMSCGAAALDGGQQERLPQFAEHAGALELFLPPLRQRRCDIPRLVSHFIEQWHGTAIREVRMDTAASLALWRCDWPGNVRQLRDEIEDALDCSRDGTLRPRSLAAGGGAAGAGVGGATALLSEMRMRHRAPSWPNPPASRGEVHPSTVTLRGI